jgi:3',5'-cyclic AMP phosphodiesterase CpdA
MRRIIHLSDLHFGRIDPAITSPLISFIGEAKPDLVAVSGDLTQRARTAEFRAARDFLHSLPFPQIVVPGNHDVPLHNLFSRMFGGLDKYSRHISADLQPFYFDPAIAVMGVNTARALTWKNGRINRRQLAMLRRAFNRATREHIKIVVTHHPFDLPAGARGDVVGRSRLAIATLAQCRVDLLLAGHFHIADTGYTAKRYSIPGFSALIVSSGTTTSTRGRGQPNSFNVITIEQPIVSIERRVWRPISNTFDVFSIEHFRRAETGWLRQ